MSNGNVDELLLKLMMEACNLVLDGKRTREELSLLLQRFIYEPKFNPAVFIGPGWKYSKPRDKRSAVLGAAIDYTTVKLSHDWLRSSETWVKGDERHKCILADHSVAALNADHFLHYWNKPSEIPEEWKPYVITFDGDELSSPDSGRFLLFLCWRGEGWQWGYRWLGHEHDVRYRAAVLAV